MAISKILANITQYISEAAMRIFGPNDDAYPAIGVQPFTGEPYDKRKDDNSQVLGADTALIGNTGVKIQNTDEGNYREFRSTI